MRSRLLAHTHTRLMSLPGNNAIIGVDLMTKRAHYLTLNTSLPRKCRPSLTRCAAAASASA